MGRKKNSRLEEWVLTHGEGAMARLVEESGVAYTTVLRARRTPELTTRATAAALAEATERLGRRGEALTAAQIMELDDA